jgi:UDP-4-amino-4,6-dideoxy-N-acetyl-beta-L-altrosamine transaminase
VIPYGKQDINQADINSVTNVLRSDFLTQGPQVPLFEKTVSDYCGAEYGIAVNSATSALHIACLSLDLGKGDWLWTSPNSFVASSNCGLYCGAKIDFVDIDPQTYNLSVVELEKKLIKAKQENKLPKILIPVHFAGQSCDMKKIHSFSKKYGFKIIEDASHAIGGQYLKKPIGGCQYSDITVFSFHPVKIITTAEGGLLTTNSKELAEKMQLYRSHGITRDESLVTTKLGGAWHYQQVALGFNYRMTELQAALGVSQMQRLDEFVAKRHILQERYDSLLSDLPIVKPYQNEDSYSALHLYPIQIDLDKVDKSREQIFNELRQNGIGVNVHYIPIHTQPYYLQFGFKEGDFLNSESYYSRTISIPLFHTMTEQQQDAVLSVLDMCLGKLCRK